MSGIDFLLIFIEFILTSFHVQDALTSLFNFNFLLGKAM